MARSQFSSVVEHHPCKVQVTCSIHVTGFRFYIVINATSVDGKCLQVCSFIFCSKSDVCVVEKFFRFS